MAGYDRIFNSLQSPGLAPQSKLTMFGSASAFSSASHSGSRSLLAFLCCRFSKEQNTLVPVAPSRLVTYCEGCLRREPLLSITASSLIHPGLRRHSQAQLREQMTMSVHLA